jgi:hypothetical protein
MFRAAPAADPYRPSPCEATGKQRAVQLAVWQELAVQLAARQRAERTLACAASGHRAFFRCRWPMTARTIVRDSQTASSPATLSFFFAFSGTEDCINIRNICLKLRSPYFFDFSETSQFHFCMRVFIFHY